MKSKKSYAIIVILAIILVSGSITAFAYSQNLSGEQKAIEYSINENGLTYGSAIKATEGMFPDLIYAYGIDGTIGYVSSRELLNYVPKTFEEKWAMSQDKNNWISIPLYKTDGNTVIGTYIIGPAAITYLDGIPGERLELLPPSFPINDKGLTYGSARYTTPLTEPDLIQVGDHSGEMGYVYSIEFHKALPEGSFVIPVFAKDGETIIGDFTIVNTMIEVK